MMQNVFLSTFRLFLSTYPAYLWKYPPLSSGVLLLVYCAGMQSGSSILIDEPSLSEHIDGLIGLLLGRLHMETGRFHEGIVFGGGIIVDEEAVSEAALLSLIVRLRDGKLSQRSRLMVMPAASAKVNAKKEREREKHTLDETRKSQVGHRYSYK